MNYIDLINQFWKIRRAKRISAYEADLYYYLLNECNSRMWLNPFELPTTLLCAELGISRKTLSDLRNRLRQKGLIEFEEGNRNKHGASYLIKYVTLSNIQGNVQGNIQGNVQGNIQGNPIRNKPNQTKQEEKEPAPLPLPGSLPEKEERKKVPPKKEKQTLSYDFVELPFKAVFMRFMEYRKELGKPYRTQRAVEASYAQLKQLSGNNVQQASLIVQQTISNEWQGLFALKKEAGNQAQRHSSQLTGYAQRLKNLPS